MRAALACIAFVPEHLAAFAPAPAFAADGLEACLPERAAASLAAGPCWTVTLAGRPVGCGGIVLLWRGVGEAWSLSAAGLGGHALGLHRIVAARLDAAQAAHALHRIQISVHGNNIAGRRWAARLGFKEEGMMHGYGPCGDDFLRMARGGPACRRI